MPARKTKMTARSASGKAARKSAPAAKSRKKGAARAPRTGPRVARKAGKSAWRNASVMVVDDEETILLLVSDLLKHNGFSVTIAGSGTECLDLLEHAKPDLLILDVMMSRITGLDVAEAVRLDPRLRDVKIIFLTVVKSTEVNPALMHRLAVSDYITKPFNNDDFIRRVKWTLMKE